jgi:hypothetical protein
MKAKLRGFSMSRISRIRTVALNCVPVLSFHFSLFILCPSCFIPHPSSLMPRRRAAQTTVEYLLMLATVSGLALLTALLFHKRLLGGMFTMIGLVLGAGKPH